MRLAEREFSEFVCLCVGEQVFIQYNASNAKFGAGVYVLQNPPPPGGNDFFYKWGKKFNETHHLNPDHNFFSRFSISEFFPQFLHKKLKKFRCFAQIVSFK